MFATKSMWATAVVTGLVMASPATFAQRPPGGAAPRTAPVGRGTLLHDRTRDQTRDLLHDQQQDRLHQRDLLHDQQQDRLYQRDLLREQDRDRIYGGSLMTTDERAQYEQRLRSLPTEQERVRYRMEQDREMQARARERQVRLGPAPSASQIRSQEQARQREREQIYGYSMMTPQEVARYQAQMGSARSAQERDRIRAEHRTQMQDRARERGEPPPR